MPGAAPVAAEGDDPSARADGKLRSHGEYYDFIQQITQAAMPVVS
jgi:hypothetical protein